MFKAPGAMEKTIHLVGSPKMNSSAVLVKRYVLADLCYQEGKTIIAVYFPLSFLFSPTLCFVFLRLDPFLVWEWLLKSLHPPPAVCAHASPLGPGPSVRPEACLGLCVENAGFLASGSSIRENGWDSA